MTTAKEIIEKLTADKKIFFLFIVGIALVVSSAAFNNQEKNETAEYVISENVYMDEKRLSKLLSTVSGAGKVQVYITYKNDGEKVVAYDSDEEERKVVNTGKNNEPYILTTKYPEIKGVLVVAEGAGNENVKNRLIRCVKSITDIPLGNICVEIRKK